MGKMIASHDPEASTSMAWDDVVWLRLKKVLLGLLGLWVTYFLLIHLFIATLNRIVVPILGLPLGVLLAAHGSLVMFLILLFVFAKRPIGMDVRSGAARALTK